MVEKEIIRGGMGAVLRVRDPDFERTLSVKVVLPKALTDHEVQERFFESGEGVARVGC